MVNKKNLVLSFIILILVIFISFITYYKFSNKEDKTETEKTEYNFSESIENLNVGNYNDLYEESIIQEITKNIEFFVIENDEGFYGSLFIDDLNRLCIRNERDNSLKILFEGVSFKTLKNDGDVNKKGLFAYALSYDGYLYRIVLTSADLDNVITKSYKFDELIEGFTTLKFDSYMDFYSYENIVITKDRKLFDTTFGLYYNPKSIIVNDQYLILEDNSIVNSYGKILLDSDGNRVKVKSIIYCIDVENIFEFLSGIIIITDTNKLIYQKNMDVMYEYEKDVSNIVDDEGIITIYFNDNTTISFKGSYDSERYPI